jgi:tight adherence protein C
LAISGDAFRLRQLVAMALAAGGCLLVELVINAVRPLAPAPGALFVGVCATGGLLLPEWQLDRRIKNRRDRMSAQLPHIAELVAFALSAGESPVASLDRVVRTTSGPLTDELAFAVDHIRAGQPIAESLRTLSRSCGVRQVQRFVDSLLVAVERGTPLAEVMRAQAADARAAAHRDLLAKAGRAEVLMLVPVIFLVLPLVVVIALYPGLANLTSAFN